MSVNVNVDVEASAAVAALGWQLMDCLAASGFDDIRKLLVLSALFRVLAERVLDGSPDGLHGEIHGLLNAVDRFGMAAMSHELGGVA